MTLVVNSRTRNLIEALEPETHTFVPMTVELATGETVENEYWLFRNGNWVEGGIIPEKSEIGVDDVKDKPWAVNKTRPPRYYVRSLVPKLVWRKEKVAGKHMWMDPALPGDLAISAELAESFKANKIKHFELVEGEAV